MVPTGRVFDPLQAAEGAVRDYCGWHVAPKLQQDWTLDGQGTYTLLVPSLKVHSVDAFTLEGEQQDPADVLFSAETGVFALRGNRVWPRGLGNVELKVTHGYEKAPGSVLGVIEALRKRAASYGGAVANQRAGTQSVTYVTGAGAGLPLTAEEKATLQRYKLEWGV